jgi:protein phosphatase
MEKLILPELSLVILIGPSGSGKSTFARRCFLSTEVISSDFCRGLITDNENDQAITSEAFDLLRTITSKRLAAGHLTVIDATNVHPEDRKPFISLAKEYHTVPVALVFDFPEKICQEHNRQRTDRQIPASAVHRQIEQMHRGLGGLKKEGFRYIYTITELEQLENFQIDRQPTWTNRKNEHGPFDIIGDVHGCCDELETLLELLGYTYSTGNNEGTYKRVYKHDQGRKAVFLGDLADRGPRNLDAIQLVRNMVLAGNALAVPGNHDSKLVKVISKRETTINHGLEKTLSELEKLTAETQEILKKDVGEFLDGLISHFVLDDGKLVVSHAGMKENMQGRASARVRDFALFGETTGETDEFGLPVRLNWATEYRGKAKVVYGHTPVVEPEWFNNTINIDSGCAFGGKLTALRYPELELVSVPAHEVYTEPVRPLGFSQAKQPSAQQLQDELLDIQDVLGKRVVESKLMGHISIPEGNSAAALEIMSRFIVNPKWLIYLPPTMSPPESTSEPGYLEYPTEAFDYYRKNDVDKVICEQKHMGSRLVAVICRNAEVAETRFGIRGEGSGILFTRTGRRFFDDPEVEFRLIEQLQHALEKSGFWQEFNTDWVCLDCELMPWSVKAQELVLSQYAAVGTAASVSLEAAIGSLSLSKANGLPVDELIEKYQNRKMMIAHYSEAYRRYCWSVKTIDDLRLAPFHILATEGKVHAEKNHIWHMDMISKLVKSIPNSVLYATPYKVITLSDPESVNDGIAWWKTLTEAGGEGMVIKPLDYIARKKGKLIQPAIKCRGREYLRIIYGAEYSTPEHLDILRQRHMAVKRSLALREFSLGLEALQRFVDHEPLRNIHECVFGVLAFESEPVDPRL